MLVGVISNDDVTAAATRITGRVRPVAVAEAGPGLFLALEHLQHTGTFKARGALNFTTATFGTDGVSSPPGAAPGTPPGAAAGVALASGGNAGLACAWAASAAGVRATVFVPTTAPAVKVRRLRELGADVRTAGSEYAEAAAAARAFCEETGAVASHAYDHPLISAGAGTLVAEILAARPEVTTVVVAVGGGGLFAGVSAAAAAHGVRVVGVEPEGSRALGAALAAGEPVDVPVASVAADSLGARRVAAEALRWAGRDHTRAVTVSDGAVVAARRRLWEEHRLVVEHGAAAALAALDAGAYRPQPEERVCVVLCGANTDPGDL
ncbi:serine/threonine dehydratase [Streptomyces spiramenti]|uniref:Serine/threonine dehydratase n=1 Tax=Streptomyces spiramenti TaxID=2720606 RepID=A0ABX1AJK4_9ACTN|nr:serine/threonine dehydratase [Streptomyces spiramenti]NJP65861.1 serine/threonine dehydratase [Streptomyces spiramenti]